MKITHNYPGASIKVIKNNEKENTIYLSLKEEANSYSHYYNFTIENSKQNEGTIYLQNIKKSPYYHEKIKQVPYTKTTKWQPLKNYSIDENGDFIIKIPTNSTQEISLVPRYTFQDLKEFIKKNHSHNTTIKYEPIPKIIIGNPKLPAIIFTARQHPGETLSSFFLEGIIKEIQNIPSLLEKYCFIFFPIVNTKGVETGVHRLLDGIDYNRSWNSKEKPFEIKCIEEELNKYKILTFIDVHNDEVTKDNYLRLNYKTSKDKIGGIKVLEIPKKYRRFLRALIKQRKIINIFSYTANEYVSKKYHCHTILVELSMSEKYENIEKLGKKFIIDLCNK